MFKVSSRCQFVNSFGSWVFKGAGSRVSALFRTSMDHSESSVSTGNLPVQVFHIPSEESSPFQESTKSPEVPRSAQKGTLPALEVHTETKKDSNVSDLFRVSLYLSESTLNLANKNFPSSNALSDKEVEELTEAKKKLGDVYNTIRTLQQRYPLSKEMLSNLEAIRNAGPSPSADSFVTGYAAGKLEGAAKDEAIETGAEALEALKPILDLISNFFGED